MSTGLIALLDDIVALTKMAAVTLDDAADSSPLLELLRLCSAVVGLVGLPVEPSACSA